MLYDLHNTLAREETKWKQKSRITWLKHRAKNKILEIKNSQGGMMQDIREIKET